MLDTNYLDKPNFRKNKKQKQQLLDQIEFAGLKKNKQAILSKSENRNSMDCSRE